MSNTDMSNEDYYQISPEILGSFPKYRPPVDLFTFDESIAVLAPFCRKGSRLTNEQVEKLHAMCAEGDVFVSRSDHHIYSRHMVFQLDLILQDANLKEGEIADICIRALVMRYEEFHQQPVKAMLEKLHADVMVITEYLWQDKYRIQAFVRRLFRKAATPAKHAVNCFSLGLWLWYDEVAEFRRKDLDSMAMAFLLHDLGMSKVPAFILSKNGPLKPDEKEKVLQHPLLGAKLLQTFDLKTEDMVRAAFEHHERLDGSGYPQKAKAANISKTGRITALVDSFSAMIMDRAYAKAKQPVQAGAELAKDPRYDAVLAKKLLTPFATGKWEMVDMDACLEAATA